MIFQTELSRVISIETSQGETMLQRMLTIIRSWFMRRMKVKSFHEPKLEFRENKSLDSIYSPSSQELLNRVQVVSDVSDSKDIVEKILAVGKPVAVDMEGVTNGITSMVQVCDTERNISLFRTGLNPSLFREGGLAKLLEAPEVMKIMHGSSNDCLSAYKDGVKLCNLYDTSVAFKVLDYQLHGTSIISSPQIGFNSLCKHFDVAENPVKDSLKNGKKGMDISETLSDEVILYCAWDVEPLHQIHALLNSSISPSYSHLVLELSDLEIIRATDSVLAKKMRNKLKNMELCSLFLSQLSNSLTLPDLLSSLSHVKGHKHVYFSQSQGTANIIFKSKEEAVGAANKFKKWGAKLGTRAKCNQKKSKKKSCGKEKTEQSLIINTESK